MTVRVQVFVACDAALSRGCAGRLDVVTAALGRAEGLARRKADEAGWVREQAPDGRWLDVCPWCNAALLAGVTAPPRPGARVRPGLPPGPRTIGEAAALAQGPGLRNIGAGISGTRKVVS
jgi:hypothetical protein